ncbi:alpha/beta hydrolase [Oerskovia sp. Root22]|uniref:alpha/beta hydrolase n=1 Tax=Oerskovia sp. Root22 TaxID=1736494 RepID=UPI0009E69781|nr:alpha/beta hydrolase [Oerskovia sp. Root22]
MVSPSPASPADSPAVRRRRWPRALAWVGASLGVVAIGTFVAFQVSPWPSALLIRYAFDKGGHETDEKLAALVPSGVVSTTDVAYRADDPDALLDVHRPASAEGPLPTVVWTHGGGWVSGSKEQVASYAKIVASHGYTVVAIDYSIAPGATYPTPLFELNDALAYVTEHADELGVDPGRIVLAGDSAGSQISAQVAGAVTSPAYARELGLEPAIGPDQLAAVVLHCGAYDIGLVDTSKGGASAWFLETVLWSYSGTKDFADDPRFAAASVTDHVTADFPPAFLTGGNADPLTPQGRALVARLAEAGVEVDAIFQPDGEEPGLGHEYQFDISTEAGQVALDRSLAFLAKHTSG